MAKTYTWEIPEEIQNENEQAETVLHTVKLTCSPTLGKAIITIDGDEYDISTGAFKLKGTSQMFRLGNLPAIITFPKKSTPTITIDNEIILPK